MYFFLLSYSILGAGIKFIDAAFDEKSFSKTIAIILAPFLGGLWAYTMFINPFSATILLSILIGVMLKGKIDNIAHLSGVLIIIPLILFLGIQLLFIPLLFLAAAALLDEIGNDYIEKTIKHLRKSKAEQMIIYFFDHRWVLKSAILFLSLLGFIPFYFFIAMVFFDYSYLAVRYMSEVKQGQKIGFDKIDMPLKTTLTQKNISKN